MPILIPKALQGLYFLCEPIADGSFGKLYLAIHALTRQQVAIKIIDKRKLGGEAFRVRGEIEALKRLSHPNIYSLYHVIETDTTFYLILEYVPGGELFDYILHHGSLREPHARLLFRQLVSAVGYSHSKGIAHRDLKPENILLKDEENIRVIDFGLCARNSDNTYLDTYCGSLAYAAPEVIANREYSGPAADIWSMGVILYAILCGCLPFDPSRPEKLPKLIAKGQYVIDESLSKSSRCLISKMLCVDPEERITMSELCKHPWVMEDWGSPIDLLVDNKQVQPLIPNIVKEISLYTRIPQAEMTRMLRKRPYDYLMATYLIMERLYVEENVMMVLQRRPHPRLCADVNERVADSATPQIRHSLRPHTTCIGSAASEGKENHAHLQFPSPPDHVSTNSHNPMLQNLLALPKATQCNMNEMPGVDALMPPPLPATCASIAAKSAGSQTPLTNEVPLQRIPKLMALSPGRSIDSQLNELTKGLRRSEPDAISRPPSAQFDHISRLDDGKSEDSSVELNSLDRPPDPRYYAVDSAEMMVHSSQSFGSSVSGADHLKAGRQSPSGASPGGSVGGAGFFKHMLLRKNTSAGRTSASKPTSKLRKVRAGDNVMLARPELSATEVLERISESLRSNSIRFTLKRHGFTCTFSNDWGRTLLKFEIEVVNVVGKYSLPKLLINKKPIGVGAKLRAPLVAVASDNPTPSPADADDDGGAPSNRISSEDVANQPCTIGVKIKRLHGDSFTYASICRAVLNQANVKEAVCI